MKKENEKLNIVFFGTPKFSVQIMEKLKGNDLTPSLLITTPNKPKGRKLILTPPETKIWAEENKIKVLQPTKLKDPEFLKEMSANNWDLFIVASYGKIIPKEILDMPKYGTINVHPSLLPRLRGASPMQSAILSEDKTGVTIMLMDEEMDHGPILIQKDLEIDNWPPNIEELEEKLAQLVGQMLVETIPLWVEGKIEAINQDHEKATYIDKISKEEAFIDLKESPEKNYRKIQALQKIKPYFFTKKNGQKIRLIIKKAQLEDGNLEILRVVPEGKKEMDYKDFLRGNN